MHHAHIALKFSARHADEGSGRHIAQSDRALRSGISNPAVNACRPGEGRPGIHTLGVGPFFCCARTLLFNTRHLYGRLTKRAASRAHNQIR